MNNIAQERVGNLAKFTFLDPKEGFEKQFDDGYKRHLNWHVENGDTWNWYGWYITSGKRFGVFVDATFRRTWAEFDKPVKPAEDRADIGINIIPFARLYNQFTCSYMEQFSRFRSGDLEASFQRVIYLKIRPGFENDFRNFLKAFSKEMPKVSAEQSFAWYRIEDGDKTPQYFLLLPHKNFAGFSETDDLFEKVLAKDELTRKNFRQSVKEVYTETMTYRADLTFIPEKK